MNNRYNDVIDFIRRSDRVVYEKYICVVSKPNDQVEVECHPENYKKCKQLEAKLFQRYGYSVPFIPRIRTITCIQPIRNIKKRWYKLW